MGELNFESQEERDWLISLLRSGPVNVTFTKSDGTERLMTCSLREDLVQQYERKTDKVKTVNESILPVFDIQKQEWRSFRWDSIKQVGGTLA
jgi:hypothetical protein